MKCTDYNNVETTDSSFTVYLLIFIHVASILLCVYVIAKNLNRNNYMYKWFCNYKHCVRNKC